MEPAPRLSFVVPAFDEAERLPTTLPVMRSCLDDLLGDRWELVVVDDGSTDGTADRARDLLAGSRHRVLAHRPNRGKGHAVRRGMLEARGDVRLFSDADLSTGMEEVPRFLARHARGFDVVIGSRSRPASRVLAHQPPLRESMGKLYTFLSSTLVVSGISDFTCGFKSFTASAATAVFPRLTVEDWAFDTELLWLVRRAGLRLAECPVRWRDDPRTRVALGRDSVRSLAALGRLFLRKHRRNGVAR